MPEQTKPIMTVQVSYLCDTCNKGEMLPTGSILLSHPPQYPHTCNNPTCDNRANFKERYPTVRYVEV